MRCVPIKSHTPSTPLINLSKDQDAMLCKKCKATCCALSITFSLALTGPAFYLLLAGSDASLKMHSVGNNKNCTCLVGHPKEEQIGNCVHWEGCIYWNLQKPVVSSLPGVLRINVACICPYINIGRVHVVVPRLSSSPILWNPFQNIPPVDMENVHWEIYPPTSIFWPMAILAGYIKPEGIDWKGWLLKPP